MKKKILILIMLLIIPVNYNAEVEEIYINNYKTVLNVSEKNKISVEEEIIFSTPSISKLEYDRTLYTYNTFINKNGNKKEVKSDIDSIFLNQASTINHNMFSKTIRLRTESEMHETAETFTIKWTQRNGPDLNKKFDEFNFFLFERDWNTLIEKFEVEVNMPKDFNVKNVKLWCTSLKNNDCSNKATIKKDKNKLLITSNEEVTGGFLLSIDLPNNYFIGTEASFGYVTLSIVIISYLLLLYSIVMFFVNKYYKRLVSKKRKMYTPYKNLSPAEIGYVNSEKTSIYKLITATIAELCGKQFIRIYEKDNELYITKLRSYRGDNEMYIAILSNIPLTNTEYKIKDNIHIFESMIDDSKKFFEDIFHFRIFRNKFNIILLAIARSFIVGALLYFSMLYIKDFNPRYNMFLYLSVFSIYASAIISFFDKKRNIYGHELVKRVNVFKNTLKLMTRGESLERIQDDRFYYYKIAPFAYVLSVFEKFDENFETDHDRLYTMGDVIFNNLNNYNELEKILSKTLE